MSSLHTTPYGTDDERTARRAELARALARGGMDNVQIISVETARAALTPKRAELIDALRRDPPASVRALARRVERDKAQVSRDLQLLAEHGLIEYDTDGRAKRPRLSQRHVVVEPLV